MADRRRPRRPDYRRPGLDLPKDYAVAQSPAPAPQKWWTVFGDPVLERFLDEASSLFS